MIIHKEPIPGTSRFRCTFESGTVLESQLVFLTGEQWESIRVLSALNRCRVSALIGKLIDEAAAKARRQV